MNMKFKTSKGFSSEVVGNQKGITSLMILLIVVAVIGVFLYMKKMKTGDDMVVEEPTYMTEEETPMEYEMLEEDETTPEEINNDTLDELDMLMEEIDSTSNEDLSDLAL